MKPLKVCYHWISNIYLKHTKTLSLCLFISADMSEPHNLSSLFRLGDNAFYRIMYMQLSPLLIKTNYYNNQ